MTYNPVYFEKLIFLASMKTGYIIYSGKTNLIKEAYVFCLAAICNPRPPRCTVLSHSKETIPSYDNYK